MLRKLVLIAVIILGGGAIVLASGVGDGSDPGSLTMEEADSRGEAYLARWIEAIGGLDRYGEMKSARFTVTTEMWDAASGRLRRARPRYVTLLRSEAGELSRIERWEGDDFIQQGWNGQMEWASLNGEPLGPGDRDFDEVRYVASDVQYWSSLPYKLRDPGVFLHDRGVDEEGRFIVEVTFGEGVGDHQDSWTYFFTDDSVWPAEVRFTEEGRTSINRMHWEDIREVDGYIFVGRRVHFNAQGQVTKVLQTSDFELNPEIDPEIFSHR